MGPAPRHRTHSILGKHRILPREPHEKSIAGPQCEGVDRAKSRLCWLAPIGSQLRGYAIFEGEDSTANGGGFASVHHQKLRLGFPGTQSYRLHVRGDGKRFKLNLRMDEGLRFLRRS